MTYTYTYIDDFLSIDAKQILNYIYVFCNEYINQILRKSQCEAFKSYPICLLLITNTRFSRNDLFLSSLHKKKLIPIRILYNR